MIRFLWETKNHLLEINLKNANRNKLTKLLMILAYDFHQGSFRHAKKNFGQHSRRCRGKSKGIFNSIYQLFVVKKDQI